MAVQGSVHLICAQVAFIWVLGMYLAGVSWLLANRHEQVLRENLGRMPGS
jgi:hypothetical protein